MNNNNPHAVYAVPVDKHDPILGPSNAKVTVIWAFEFLCPFSYLSSDLVDLMLIDYPNDVRVVCKYRMVHGTPALIPALGFFAASKQVHKANLLQKASNLLHGKSAESEAYRMQRGLWEELWDDENHLIHHKVDEKTVFGLASSLGMDTKKFQEDMYGTEAGQWIRDSMVTLNRFNVHTIPGFFINGRFTDRQPMHAQPMRVFRKLIEEEIQKADVAIASGIKMPDYYKTIVTNGEQVR